MHWTEEDMSILQTADSFQEAADVAVAVLARMKTTDRPIVQICGPMSTGGRGNLQENLALFQKAIEVATEKGLLVFNQIPFQEVIDRIDTVSKTGEYCHDILEVFYRRVFESGYIDKALFLPGWEGSFGATWERNLVVKLGISIEDYPPEWLNGY